MSNKKRMWPKLGRFRKNPQSRAVGRVLLSRQAHYTKAEYGTDECQAEYVALVQAWHANGCQPLKRRARLPQDCHDPKTISELVDTYIQHLRDTRAYPQKR